MAQALTDQHSNRVVGTSSLRHIHISRQVKGADVFAANIQPVYDNFSVKEKARQAISLELSYKLDTVILQESFLGDRIRDLSQDCQRYDRDHPGLTVTPLVFTKIPSEIIHAASDKIITEAENLIVRLNELEADHVLKSNIEPIQTCIDECKAAQKEYDVVLVQETKAKTDQDVAKKLLIRQYEQNIYAASAKFGKTFANRLFPKLNKIRKKKNNKDTDDTEE